MEAREAVWQTLRDAGIADVPILLMVRRDGKFIQPEADKRVEAGDVLTFLGKQETILRMQRQFFPDEEYSSSRTFQQLYGRFLNSVGKYRPKK